MPHNSKAWPGGLTNGVTAVDAAEMAQLDANGASAVNGDDGGTWSPATVIEIGGEGIKADVLRLAFRAITTGYVLDASGPDVALICDTTGPGYPQAARARATATSSRSTAP